jgi:hypothetical protein
MMPAFRAKDRPLKSWRCCKSFDAACTRRVSAARLALLEVKLPSSRRIRRLESYMPSQAGRLLPSVGEPNGRPCSTTCAATATLGAAIPGSSAIDARREGLALWCWLWLTQERRRLRRVGSDGSLWDLASDTGSRHSPHSAHARAAVGGPFIGAHWLLTLERLDHGFTGTLSPRVVPHL